MKNKSTLLLAAMLSTAFLLSSPLIMPPAHTASIPINGPRLGFWLQEGDIFNYTPKTFFNAMFLTPPYPSSAEIMIFAPLQAQKASQGCSASSGFVGSSLSYWGQVAQQADAYPNIRLVFMIAFVPSTPPYDIGCFNTMVQTLSQYSSVYGLGVEGEYTNPGNGLTNSIMQTAYNDVAATGKQFINYYIKGAITIPSGGYQIYHTNFPAAGDQVGTLSNANSQGSQIVGIDSGYYYNFPFPQNAITCPIGPNAIVTGSVEGWNQCVVSTELSTAVSLSASVRQFVEFDVGFSLGGAQVWNDPNLRNWIWTDPNYKPNFVLATSSTTTTSTTSVSSTTSSSTTRSTTTKSTSTSATSTTTSTDSSNSQTSSVTTSRSGITSTTGQDYALSVTGDCPSTGAGSYAYGSTAMIALASVCNRNGESGLRVTSWSLDGGNNVTVATQGTLSISVLMNAPHTVMLYTVVQYSLSLDYGAQASLISITPPTILGDNYWYDSGSIVTFMGGVKLQGYTVVGWAIDGASPVSVSGVPDYVSSLTMTGPHSLHVLLSPTNNSCSSSSCASIPAFDVTIQTNSNLPSGVWVDNGYYPRSVTFAWQGGSEHNLTAAAGGRRSSVGTTFSHWSGESGSQSPTLMLTVNESGYLTAVYAKQYLVSLSFTDTSGEPLTPQSVTLTGPLGAQRLGVNMTAWVEPGASYAITSVIWMNWNVVMSNDSTFSVNQPTSLSFSTIVFPQTVKVTDVYNLPVRGATVNVTALNGIRLSVVTDFQGIARFRVPAGLFSATVAYLGVGNQIAASTEGSHDYTISFLLSYPLIETAGAISAITAAFALFRLRKRPDRKGVYYFAD